MSGFGRERTVCFRPVADIRRCVHLPTMLRMALCLMFVLASCSNEKKENSVRAPGWTAYLDKYRNAVFFRFADRADTTFNGVCDSRPFFALYGGDYPDWSESFTLTIDRQSWNLSAFQGEHGRSLPVDDPQFVDLFRNAKQRISFRVGPNWVRSFRPSPLLRAFIDKCRAMRIRDPEAMGI